ncbi:MAG: dihydroxyacetone kinase, partial [Anaerolineaceae bacterium 4572_5.2]
LPNNKNIIPAAQQAGSLAEKTVQVLPSESIPQGISAALAFNTEADFDLNAARMLNALKRVQTIEITQAARSVRLNGLQVNRGDVIGLLNNTLTAAGSNINQVVLDILAQQDIGNIELISIYYGQDASTATANALADLMTAACAHLKVEVIYGGQAHNHYIISLE